MKLAKIEQINYINIENYMNVKINKKRIFDRLQDNDIQNLKIESLDNIHIENCGFIKLDVEGFEYPALRGAKKFIKKHKPNIFVEIHTWFINEKKHNYKDEVFKLLKELNYKLDYTFSGINDEFIFIPK